MSQSPAIYADSSFLISLHCDDSNADAAREYMRRKAATLVFNPLHRLEVRNGLRLRVFQGSMTPTELSAALRLIENDLADGLLLHVPLAWTDALRQAEKLSAAHAEELGCRAADTLHVAAALLAESGLFLSFDKKQRALAKAAGLQVKP